jgi:beta-glucosidase
VLETCHKHGLAPMVSLNHWSVPRWFAARGGFEEADSVQLFARFAEKAATRLGGLMTAATTFNEANITRLARVLFKIDSPRIKAVMGAMFAAAAKASGTDKFASVLLANIEKAEANQVAAHHAAVKAVKAARSGLPIGLTLAMQEMEGVGAGHRAAAVEEALYGPWLDAAASGDFVGVQTYTRIRVGKDGPLEVPEGAEKTAAGFEFYPQALGATIRYAAQRIRKPIYVTENGIATNDDSRRIAYIDTAVRELRKAKAEGIDVRGYFHWSLLDNFEWTFGFAQRYGLIAVDPTTFKRTPKPSAMHLGRIVRSGRG